MNIKEQIKADMVTAMKAKESEKVMALRSIIAAFTNELVSLKRTPQDELSDEEGMAVIKRAVKQRKEAMNQFTEGGRPDLAEKEQSELAILEVYLPDQMSEEEVRNIAIEQKDALGIDDRTKMGVLIGAVVKATGGNADGGMVKNIVMSLFD